jgi:hypothetical protein
LRRKKILAVASAGGHWVQLNRMLPAFKGFKIHWISTCSSDCATVEAGSYTSVRDASMWDKLDLLVMALQVGSRVLILRPDVVITTGAAPGFFAIMFGRLIGAKTIWIDSLANGQELSQSGRHARIWATHWLTQWPGLVTEDGPKYIGSVL